MRAMQVPLAGQRILAVEDEVLISLDVEQILKNAGAHVDVAYDVRTALGRVGSVEFSGAVLDLQIHDETAEPVCALLTERAIPFIFLSAFDQPPGKWSNVHLVRKPYLPDVLVEGVRECLVHGTVFEPRQPTEDRVERLIAEADGRIVRQRRLISSMRTRGHPTQSAEELLKLMLESLELLHGSRSQFALSAPAANRYKAQ